MHAIEIEIGRLRPAPWNANKVTPSVMRKIRRSIERFGVVENLVARPLPETDQLEVISGNHRLQILEELGFERVPVVVVDLDDAHARILAQTLNRTRGQDDPQAYAKLLEDVLQTVGAQTALGYLNESEASLERALSALPGRNLADLDDAPPPPAKADSQPGEVYELGDHRLICGDSTDPKIWAKLLDGETGQLVLTDPPYGVDYGAKTRDLAQKRGKRTRPTPTKGHRDLVGDSTGDTPEFRAMLLGAFTNARAHTAAGGPIYVFHSDATPSFRATFLEAGWHLHQTLVWAKNHAVLTRQDYHSKHEPVLYGWNRGAAHRWYGTRVESTLIGDDFDPASLTRKELVRLVKDLQNALHPSMIREDRPQKADVHPTMKPVRLLEYLLLNSSDRGDTVLDPFGGSGSTLMACERRGRRCFTIELDPAYCDVIRRRYETALIPA